MAPSTCIATRSERRRSLPGDTLVPEPMFESTHAITIDATPEHVWPWLVQMGGGRAGWYSWDAIDNGAQPSASRLEPGLQHVEVGEVMPAIPGARDAFVVTALDPPRDLVLTVPDPAGGEVVSWEHYLEPVGDRRTRLIVRGRVSPRWRDLARETRAAGEHPIFIERAYGVLAKLPRPLLVAAGAIGHRWMEARHLREIRRRAESTFPPSFLREIEALASASRNVSEVANGPVTDEDLATLPEAAQRYLHFMRVVGRPRDRSFRLGWEGQFRRSAGVGWMHCRAWQFDTRIGLARVFRMQGQIGALPVVARDTYLRGHGRMQVRALGLMTLGDRSGEPFDLGELVSYLVDAVLFAPSMLLVPEARWSAVDDNSFDVTLTDDGHTVTARVFLDARGAPTDVASTDRFCADPADESKLIRARWTTPVEDWREIEGRMLPMHVRAVWHLPGDGVLPYAEFELLPESVAFDVA